MLFKYSLAQGGDPFEFALHFRMIEYAFNLVNTILAVAARLWMIECAAHLGAVGVVFAHGSCCSSRGLC